MHSMVHRRGFTLIELLVVIAILAVLLSIGAMQYGKFLGKGDETKTVALIESVKGVLEQYRNATGDYPSSRLTDYGIKSRNGLFDGNEALVVALHHKDYDGERLGDRDLRNLDDDRADKNVTIFDQPVLLELVDAWENPLVYIRYDDYGREQEYEFRNNETDELETERVKAVRNELTASYAAKESYQLISAGQDGVLGTSDDKTSF